VGSRRVLPFDNMPIEIAVTQTGPCDTPRLQVSLAGPGLRLEFKEQAKSMVEKMLGLRVDLAPFYRMAKHDAKLHLLVENFRGVKPPRFPTIFETLANAFACQQLSLTVGLGMLNRMSCACGLSLELDGETSYAFPRPEDLIELAPDEIRVLGFSGKKKPAHFSNLRRTSLADELISILWKRWIMKQWLHRYRNSEVWEDGRPNTSCSAD
jgi:DNA-3-methyladenine glycosylase II